MNDEDPVKEETDVDLSLTKESGQKEEHFFTMDKDHNNSYNIVSDQTSESSVSQPMSLKQWLSEMKWSANPFIFTINPSLRVGYKQQTERIIISLEEHHKFLLVLGPTGSGKTTFLKWLETRLKGYEILFIGKPPANPDEFAKIISKKYPKPWYAFWKTNLDSVYQIPDFLNSKIKKKHLILMMDESQEATIEVLEWLRALNDQIENMSVLLSGLPSFEDQLKNNLETFAKRVTSKAELLYLTKEETKELISKRIRNVGGRGNEFDHIIDDIHNYTGGFPREIIRVCDEIVNNSIMKGTTEIKFSLARTSERIRPIENSTSIPNIEKMTPMQKEILELLSKKHLTPGQIADTLELEKYKSRQHAVRSVNNEMKAMFEEGLLERRKEDKAFVYSLSTRISTLFVKR